MLELDYFDFCQVSQRGGCRGSIFLGFRVSSGMLITTSVKIRPYKWW